ncbi:MAG: YdcH family protein [Pseudomonadota bacterium]
MSHVPHELAEEFPEHVEAIHTLKTTNAHFAKLFEDYHELNRQIHRAETDVEPTSDARMIDLRRRRLAVKDEVYALLKQA